MVGGGVGTMRVANSWSSEVTPGGSDKRLEGREPYINISEDPGASCLRVRD